MTTAETTSTAEAKERSGAGGQGARKDARALLGIIAAILVVALFCSYYLSIARKTDICFDGAVFLQPIVALERFGVLTHTYNTQSPAEFHLPLTNLGQGMLSQNILNWPFIHLFGINHFALQAANLIFLGLGGALMYLLVLRSTGNRLLPLAGVLLFYTAPQMKGLGLQGLGEVPAASYLLLCAMLLYLALSRGRYFGWLGIAVFLAFHTKNYLILVYPMLLLVAHLSLVAAEDGAFSGLDSLFRCVLAGATVPPAHIHPAIWMESLPKGNLRFLDTGCLNSMGREPWCGIAELRTDQRGVQGAEPQLRRLVPALPTHRDRLSPGPVGPGFWVTGQAGDTETGGETNRATLLEITVA